MKRDPQPSAAVVDSQSIKTISVGGEQRGYDGGKKVKGRKRHLLVDTQGLVLKVRIHSARVMDRDGIKVLLDPSSWIVSRASPICGWTQATTAKTRVQIGCRRHLVGRPTSSGIHRSRFRMR